MLTQLLLLLLLFPGYFFSGYFFLDFSGRQRRNLQRCRQRDGRNERPSHLPRQLSQGTPYILLYCIILYIIRRMKARAACMTAAWAMIVDDVIFRRALSCDTQTSKRKICRASPRRASGEKKTIFWTCLFILVRWSKYFEWWTSTTVYSSSKQQCRDTHGFWMLSLSWAEQIFTFGQTCQHGVG